MSKEEAMRMLREKEGFKGGLEDRDGTAS